MQSTIKIILILFISLAFNQTNSSTTLIDSTQTLMPLSKKIFWGEKGIVRKLNLAPKDRTSELKLRHKMLQLHQKLGLLTLGLVSYQTYLGNQLKQGKYGNNKKLHRNLGYTSFTLYMTSASLSVLSPPAIKYSNKISSVKVHRYLSYIHFAGMLCMPYLGYLSSGQLDTPGVEYRTKALKAHDIIGKITFATLSLSFLTTLIP